MSTPRTLTLPPGVTRAQVETPVGSFAVLTAGPPSSALPVVVLVPGWTGSKEDFLTLLPELAVTGRRVVALDQRGQHDTPGPDSVDDYSLDGFAMDLLALVEAISDGPVDLLGHSFGGLVATRVTVLAPSAVSSLVLLCSGPGALPAERHFDLAALVQGLQEQGAAVTWAAMRERERASGAQMPPAEIESWLRDRFLRSSPAALIAKTRLLAETPDQREPLRNRPTPTLVMAGSLDDGWPVDVQVDLAASIGAELDVLEGLGHSPAVEDPARTAQRLVAFWDAWRPGPVRTGAVLSADTSEVRRARHLVRHFLTEVLPGVRRDEAELLTSELVTNALIHAKAPVHLDVVVRGGYVMVLVADSGGGPELESRIHHGRGLPIVTALAHRCGGWTTDDGAIVWFWMPVGQPRSTSACTAAPLGSSPSHEATVGPTSMPSGHDSR